MSRFATLAQLAALGAALLISPLAQAQTAPAKGNAAASHKVPMHPSTLTLGGKRRHKPIHPHHVRHTFHQPTPIHGTMTGPRM